MEEAWPALRLSLDYSDNTRRDITPVRKHEEEENE